MMIVREFDFLAHSAMRSAGATGVIFAAGGMWRTRAAAEGSWVCRRALRWRAIDGVAAIQVVGPGIAVAVACACPFAGVQRAEDHPGGGGRKF